MKVFHEDEDTAIVCAPQSSPARQVFLAVLTCVKGHATNPICPKCTEFSLGSTRKLLTFRKLPSMYKGLDVLALLYINRNELRQPLASYLLAQDWR